MDDTLQYKYDAMGNIVAILENGKVICRYEYDALGRLTREDNVPLGKTTTRTYDSNGNVIASYEYAVTMSPTDTLQLRSAVSSLFTYRDDSDRLISCYNDQKGYMGFEYDEIGNPAVYRGKNASWQNGRQMVAFDGHTFAYDARGRRTNKDNITFTYDSDGNLVKQSNGLEFLYDHTGVFAVKYDNATYYYRKDAQGNVIALLDNSGAIVVKYLYDAWGNCLTTVLDIHATGIANLNPFRYRGYYYDVEIKLYFLKTRYYDPEIGRFLTIDDVSYLDPDSINGLNLYASCGNNPVMRVDPNGKFALSTILFGCLIAFIVGATVSVVSQVEEYGWDGISVNQVLFDGLFAAASVVLAASGISFWGSVAVGAAMGFAQYAYQTVGHHESITLRGALIATVVGGIGGAISGAGAQNLSAYKKVCSGFTGKAEVGFKAWIATIAECGYGSRQMTLVKNLYQHTLRIAFEQGVEQYFVNSVRKILAVTILNSVFSDAISSTIPSF